MPHIKLRVSSQSGYPDLLYSQEWVKVIFLHLWPQKLYRAFRFGSLWPISCSYPRHSQLTRHSLKLANGCIRQSLTALVLFMRPASERRRYIVTSSLIGWVHTQNDPCEALRASEAKVSLIHIKFPFEWVKTKFHIKILFLTMMWNLYKFFMECLWRNILFLLEFYKFIVSFNVMLTLCRAFCCLRGGKWFLLDYEVLLWAMLPWDMLSGTHHWGYNPGPSVYIKTIFKYVVLPV